MTILKKTTATMLAGAVLLTQVSCSPYTQVTLAKEEIVSNSQLREDFSRYDIYVHDRTNTYKLKDPLLNGNTIQGKPEQVLSSEEAQEIRSPKTRKELKAHRYDLNIYTQKDVVSYTAGNDSSIVLHKESLTLDASDIERLGAYEMNRKKAALGAVAIVAIVVVSILLVIIVAGAVSSSGDGSGNSGSNSGDSGSGNSGSGSDSGSGGSGSGSGSN
jgi:hypothetical protein